MANYCCCKVFNGSLNCNNATYRKRTLLWRCSSQYLPSLSSIRPIVRTYNYFFFVSLCKWDNNNNNTPLPRSLFHCKSVMQLLQSVARKNLFGVCAVRALSCEERGAKIYKRRKKGFDSRFSDKKCALCKKCVRKVGRVENGKALSHSVSL